VKREGGDGDLELTEEEAVDVGRLGDVCGGEGGSAVEEGDSEFWVGRETELTHEVCHTHTLWWC
jgi:hypothetical protein